MSDLADPLRRSTNGSMNMLGRRNMGSDIGAKGITKRVFRPLLNSLGKKSLWEIRAHRPFRTSPGHLAIKNRAIQRIGNPTMSFNFRNRMDNRKAKGAQNPQI